MSSENAVVARIRPVSWKVSVVGSGCAEHVRGTLRGAGFECTAAAPEPELQDPPLYSFVATPKAGTPVTAPELKALFDRNGQVEAVFDT